MSNKISKRIPVYDAVYSVRVVRKRNRQNCRKLVCSTDRFKHVVMLKARGTYRRKKKIENRKSLENKIIHRSRRENVEEKMKQIASIITRTCDTAQPFKSESKVNTCNNKIIM